MNIYIVIVEDRHHDVEVLPFTNKDKAIAEARRIAKENCRHEESYEEHTYVKEWPFFATYSCEGDSVRVVVEELDEGEA